MAPFQGLAPNQEGLQLQWGRPPTHPPTHPISQQPNITPHSGSTCGRDTATTQTEWFYFSGGSTIGFPLSHSEAPEEGEEEEEVEEPLWPEDVEGRPFP
jgi:hypothetical protein